nr:pyridoxal-phosphate dependent enzyme [uncultured bacterium]AIA13417.1 Pyridoxal-phosphate dependent enzyme [uncultured bacterium]
MMPSTISDDLQDAEDANGRASQPDDHSMRAWLLSRIEETPLLSIEGFHSLTKSQVWAQCEFFAPTGSHKDRMYMHIIQQLERKKLITHKTTLIDYSSGNGGAALAFVAKLLGYEAVIVRPEGMSFGKAAQITALGARLIETPKAQGVEGAIQGARELAKSLGDRCYLIDQGELSYNSEAYDALGKRMGETLKQRGVEPNYFICSIGTGGTFSGIAKQLKRIFPGIRCIAVDIEGQTMLSHTFGGHVLSSQGHLLEGISVGKIFSQVDTDLIDDFIVIKQSEAIEACRLLWLKTQILAGFSSGANMAAISKLPAGCAVTVFFDSVWKYFDNSEMFLRPMRDRRSSLYQVLDWLQYLES